MLFLCALLHDINIWLDARWYGWITKGFTELLYLSAVEAGFVSILMYYCAAQIVYHCTETYRCSDLSFP